MNNRYSHLLSPLKIGNVVLKNRMSHTNALLHFLQGPESFPAEGVMSFYTNVARNGAAIVTVRGSRVRGPRKDMHGDQAHMPIWDMEDPSVHNYMSQLADAIHFYDSKASVSLMNILEPSGYNISNVEGTEGMFHVRPGKEIPVELMQQVIEDGTKKAKLYKSLGFDMVTLYMSYRNSLLAYSLSPVINKRTDKYGGSVENRARFTLELCQAIKKACGQDFLIEAQISGEEKEGGYTIEDTIEYARVWEGTVDILQLRAPDASAAHPTGFNSQKKYPLTLRYAQAIKESGVKIITAPNGGYQDLDLSEEYIASGKTDMVAMARAFICEPEYGKKAYEGRGEDVTPCIRCNKCHGVSMNGHWFSVCSTNPTAGIAHKVDRMVSLPTSTRKVAVIGGGPAGMKAAIVAAGRGHQVTLYEKNYFMGGQLHHADFSSFKWPLRDFKDYLIRQTYKAGVEVLLNTDATTEMIKAMGYDVVIVAAGAEPVIPESIPGADGSSVWMPINVYGNEKALGEKIVVIGGSEIGVETGMYLAESGHKVTVLTRQKQLAHDATPIHYIEMFRDAWESLDTFSYVTEAITTAISDGKVTYVDAAGNEKSIAADSVVFSGGLRPRQDEALKFYGSAGRFFIIGDCRSVGNVQECMRTAFAAASQL